MRREAAGWNRLGGSLVGGEGLVIASVPSSVGGSMVRFLARVKSYGWLMTIDMPISQCVAWAQ